MENELKKQPFFIVGVGRSGTTLLRLMLNSHTQIAIPYETHFLSRYANMKDVGTSIEEFIDKLLSEEMIRKWDVVPTREEVLAALQENTVPAVIDAVFSVYAAQSGKQRWGDKSDYLDSMHLINELFPQSKFIHIIRDGRDVARSVIRLPWGPDDLVGAASWWSDHVHLARIVGRVLGHERYLEVRYEDLVIEPNKELERVCEFIGENFELGMLDYYKHSRARIPDERHYQHQNIDRPPEPSRCYAWKREMLPVDIAVFEDYASATLSACGYSVDSVVVPEYRTIFRKLRSLIIRRAKGLRKKNGSINVN